MVLDVWVTDGMSVGALNISLVQAEAEEQQQARFLWHAVECCAFKCRPSLSGMC
jgi:hypothetical protein